MSKEIVEKLEEMIDAICIADGSKIIELDNLFTIGVYVLLQDSEVVYVGQSIDVSQRIRRHVKEGKKIFDEVRVIEYEKQDLLQRESELISLFKPKYNKTKTDGFYGCCTDIVKTIFIRNEKELNRPTRIRRAA